MSRTRQIRGEATLPPATVLVRMLFDYRPDKPVFDRDGLITDATFNFTEFGYYGLSLWATSPAWPLDRVLAEKVRVARHVALFTAGDLRDHGLGLVPSGRLPHYDTTIGEVYGQTFGSVQVTAPSAADLIDRFVSATYTVLENPVVSHE